MRALSGWCAQLGRPNHNGCRFPETCQCPCHREEDGDPEIKFGGDKVGGIKIRAMSNLPGNKRMAVALTVTRGKRAPYVVEPLPDSAPTSPPVDEDTVARLADLRAEWKTANPDRRKVIEAEVNALSAADDIKGGDGDE